MESQDWPPIRRSRGINRTSLPGTAQTWTMGRPCSFDTDCDRNNYCCQKTRRCVQIGLFDPCLSSTQCPQNSSCHPVLGKCYPSSDQKVSLESQLCFHNGSAPAASEANVHPAESFEWDMVDGTNCRSDRHCPKDDYCKGGKCIPLPALFENCLHSGGQCRRPFICATSSDWQCKMPCWSNFECRRNFEWWSEAAEPASLAASTKGPAEDERDRPCCGQRGSRSFSSQQIVPMEEGNQGFCVYSPSTHASLALGMASENTNAMNNNDKLLEKCITYDWCVPDGNYCDTVQRPSSSLVIFFFVLPILVLIVIYILWKFLTHRRSPSNENQGRYEDG